MIDRTRTHLTDDEINDFDLVTLWEVEVEESGRVLSTSLCYVLDPGNGMKHTDRRPSAAFMESAQAEIAGLNWVCAGTNDEGRMQTAVCYVMKSDPDSAACSNDMER